jgi:hypothetical protein
MSFLAELIPQPEKVLIGEKVLDVYGLSFRQLAGIISRFPKISELFLGSGLAFASILSKEPEAGLAIMAAGCHAPKESEHEFEYLSASAQIDIIGAVFNQTFPQGLGPFSERIAQLVSTLDISPAPDKSAASTESFPAASAS